jgi:hypothetical protein
MLTIVVPDVELPTYKIVPAKNHTIYALLGIAAVCDATPLVVITAMVSTAVVPPEMNSLLFATKRDACDLFGNPVTVPGASVPVSI